MFILRQEWPLLHLVNKEFQDGRGLILKEKI